MRTKTTQGVPMKFGLILTAFLFTACASKVSYEQVVAKANKFNNRIDILKLENKPIEITENIDQAIKTANEQLKIVVDTPKSQRNFQNTIAVLDQIFFDFDRVANRHYFMNSVSPKKELRDAATLAIQKINKWYNEVFFREDLYKAFNEYASTNPKLSGPEKRLYDDIKKGFKKNGFHLSRYKRQRLQKIKNEMSQTSTKFSNNIREFKNIVKFTEKELEGVPASALESLKQDSKGNYLMDARIVSHYLVIAKYAKSEAARKKALKARSTVAKKANAPLMTKLVKLRSEMAKILGYKNYADLAIEDKMAKDGATAVGFIQRLSKGLETKFQAEQKLLTELKRKETKDPKAVLRSWDGAYYERLYLENKFSINEEELKEYFSMGNVLKGMYSVYEEIFGIKLKKLELSNKWIDDLQAYIVYDDDSGEPLGTLYLDLYPREGKYNHFAQFGLLDGKTLPNGQKQRPVAVLVCNFPEPVNEKPSLLSYDHVETLFHEFGHALHNILSKTKYASHHGTSVPRDFVEAPSQMLEFWVRNKEVLDTFGKHYVTGEKIPRDLLDNLFASKKVFIGRFTRGQIAYAMTDLNLHTQSKISSRFDVIKETNDTIAKYYMPRPKGSSFITSFGHLAGGYAAGYYGYQWSLAIASDMALKFENAEDKFFDKEVGMKLRKEIYEVGDSRDVNVSIEKFLGRKSNLDAYLKELGIK